jgi:cell pole-organizing protein PopZ
MTQPAAKAQEPSMEEILASIRRIISDDEAKPAAAAPPEPVAAPAPVRTEAPKAETPRPASAARAQVMAGIPPSKISPARSAAPAAAPTPAAKNSQADIDAMLAEFDAPAPAAKIAEPEPDADVFELTEQMALPETPPTPPPAPPSFRTVEPEDDLEFSEPPAPPAVSRSPVLDPPAYGEPARERPQPPILSSTTVTAVESAFNTLASTVLSNNARTLEDLVKEMLRPMLKSWLDDNLPNLVERIVKAEIERVSRGR